MKNLKCPCCENYTIIEIFDICDVCYWQYDKVAHNRGDEYVGGANKVSLTEARNNYKKFGASEKRFENDVRSPRSDELPENRNCNTLVYT